MSKNIKICLNCGKKLERNKYYCSHKCRAEYIQNMKTCVICGKKFPASPSSGKLTCSKECERIERANNGKVGAHKKQQKKVLIPEDLRQMQLQKAGLYNHLKVKHMR